MADIDRSSHNRGGEEAHRSAGPAHDQPVAVMLDLVHPAVPDGRFGSEAGNAGLNEAVGANNQHGRQ
jgi:hypothetical protein